MGGPGRDTCGICGQRLTDEARAYMSANNSHERHQLIRRRVRERATWMDKESVAFVPRGHRLSIANIAREAGCSERTVKRYIQRERG